MRILHISDYHLGQEGIFDQELLAGKMLHDVERHAKEVPFDLVIFTGDIAATGQSEEFNSASEQLLTPLKNTLSLSNDRIILVPGNHDIDRTLISKYQEPGLQSLNNTIALDSLLAETQEFQTAFRRLSAWTNFHSEFYADCSSIQQLNPLAVVHRLTIDNADIGIAALNSAWRATGSPNDEDRNRLLIGESQTCAALDAISTCALRIVAFHHPLEWLAEWNHSAIRSELESRGTIVFTGHEHVPDPRLVRSTRGSAIYLPTGCLYQGRDYPNSYSIIDLDIRDKTLKVRLYSWKEPRKDFDLATEYVENGELELEIPDAREVNGLPLPKYTKVTSALAQLAHSSSSFAELIDDIEPRSITDILVEPRFYRAPFNQVAAAAMLANSQNKPVEGLRCLDITHVLNKNQVAIISGEALSGVSHALLWILADRYQIDTEHVPVPTKFRPLQGKDPLDRLVREFAPQVGLSGGPRDSLPSLIVAIDDVVVTNPTMLKRMIAHIKNHPQNLFVFGVHGNNGRLVAEECEGQGITFVQAHLGPFGRLQLKQLITTLGNETAAQHVDRIMTLVFDQHLPRSPFLLMALIAVVSADQSAKPPNESALLEALIGLLLGKFDPSDTEVGLDPRGREHLLQQFAKYFEVTGTDRLSRTEAETFIGKYFTERGIEGSASPGKLLNALINRRIIIDDDRGVGFQHSAFQDVVAAMLMRENPEFAELMLADPPKYASVIKHAASLLRDNGDWLKRIGEATESSIASVIARNNGIFDKFISPLVRSIDEEQLEEWLEAAAPKSSVEQDAALDQHYDYLETSNAVESPINLPSETLNAIGATQFLSAVLAGSELVDDVTLKTQLLKEALKGWAGIADELGSLEEVGSQIRLFFEETFSDIDDTRKNRIWQLMVRASMVLSVSMGLVGTLGSVGLGTSILRLNNDEEINESPLQSFYLTLLYCELNLDGTPDRIRATFFRHRGHLFVPDIMHALAFTRYLSLSTGSGEVKKLEVFLLDSMESPSSGSSSAVLERSSVRSRNLTMLHNARLKHRSDSSSLDLIEDFLAPKELSVDDTT